MASSLHAQTIELLLDSIFASGDGLRHTFIYGRPGCAHWERNMGTEIFYRRSELIKAVLFTRQNGAPYLRYVSISEIWSMLTNFVSENYWFMMRGDFSRRTDCSYAQQVGAEAKANLAEALSRSPLFTQNDQLTLFPIITVRISDGFDGGTFFFTRADALTQAHLPDTVSSEHLSPADFPPLQRWDGKRYHPPTWLGIRAPLLPVANKLKSAILGAVALCPLPRYRYMFSGRAMFGGYCTLSGGGTTAYGEAHTPPLMDDVILTADDHEWLAILNTLLGAADKVARSRVRALEYFYRAWFQDESERFPWLCMTLDAIFGDANHATQAVIDGVRGVLGAELEDARLRMLMDLRASVIHGGAPDVYDSRKYARYYTRYDADPILDLEIVVARCLRAIIFDDRLRVQPDPHAEVIAAAKAKGKFPKSMDRHTIVPEDL